MPRFLLFRLYGPLAAWGEIAVGERRASWDRPSKSSVLGLVAGALGLRRDQESDHVALHSGLGFAVRVDRPGSLLRDFHTAQVPPAAVMRNRNDWTRADELAVDDLGTIVSWRDYLADSMATAALWTAPSGPGLEPLAVALRRPVFAPYLGRKSCPPTLPFAPLVVEAAGLLDAFVAYDAERPLPIDLRIEDRPVLFWEAEPSVPGLPNDWRPAHRRDGLMSRRRWQFREREERVTRLGEAMP